MATCASFGWKGGEKGGGVPAAAMVWGGRQPALVAGVAEQKEEWDRGKVKRRRGCCWARGEKKSRGKSFRAGRNYTSPPVIWFTTSPPQHF